MSRTNTTPMMQQREAWTSIHMASLGSGSIAIILLAYNFVHGQSSVGSNWAKGHYAEEAKPVDSVGDMVRKETGNSDSFQVDGFTDCMKCLLEVGAEANIPDEVLLRAVHWIQLWAYLLPEDQRELMVAGCNRLRTVTQDCYFRATGWRHVNRLEDG